MTIEGPREKLLTIPFRSSSRCVGMDFFNEYLWGKQFILYTDHKPLEKLGHLHNKMLNRLQKALLGHYIIIQYKTDQTCQQTIYPDFRAQKKMLPAFLPSNCFKLTFSNSRCKMNTNRCFKLS